MLYGPNTNNGSIIYMIECQVHYVMAMLDAMDAHDLAWVDVKRDVMDEYNDEVQHALDGVEVWQAGCNGYYRVRRANRHAVAGFDERVPRLAPNTSTSPPTTRRRFCPWMSASPSPTPVATRHPSGSVSTARPRSSWASTASGASTTW